MVTRPSAFLFDWDNTLVDTWPIIHEALHKTFTALGMQPWTFEEVKQRVARSMRDAFPAVFGEKAGEASEIYQREYRAIHLNKLKALPDAEKTLAWLQSQKFFVGVVSNKKNVNLKVEIDALGWGKYFATIIGSGDAPQDKPSPEPVYLALAPAKIPCDARVWFIGDSLIDLECCKNASCSALFYGNDHQAEEAGAQLKINEFPILMQANDHKALLKFFQATV